MITVGAEKIEWYNTMILVGSTEKRGGNAWHYRLEHQGDESNHYPGFIPIEDIERRLFDWEAIEAPTYYVLTEDMVNGVADPSNVIEVTDSNGNKMFIVKSAQSRKGMLTSDTLFDLGAFKSGFCGHQYREWLLKNFSHILDDGLGVDCAGLLENRAVAFVTVSVPDTITTPEGVEFRPNMLGTTSFNGTVATTYKRVVTATVCDNTRNIALREKGQEYKVKHTKHSHLRIQNAREALAIVMTTADDFMAEVAALTNVPVTEKQWNKSLNALVPIPDEDGRGKTVAENKQAELIQLYRNDPRAAPWQDTVFGALQAVNTWNHHFSRVHNGANRFGRTMGNVIRGKMGEADQDFLTIMSEAGVKIPQVVVAA